MHWIKIDIEDDIDYIGIANPSMTLFQKNILLKVSLILLLIEKQMPLLNIVIL